MVYNNYAVQLYYIWIIIYASSPLHSTGWLSHMAGKQILNIICFILHEPIHSLAYNFV
jgi:hypothetical protein